MEGRIRAKFPVFMNARRLVFSRESSDLYAKHFPEKSFHFIPFELDLLVRRTCFMYNVCNPYSPAPKTMLQLPECQNETSQSKSRLMFLRRRASGEMTNSISHLLKMADYHDSLRGEKEERGRA